MMKTFSRFLTVCALAIVATSARAIERTEVESWLDGVVPYALEQGDIAGLVIAVVQDGQVVLEKGYGYADVVKRVPADPERTLMRAASVSKTFTATAVMQLVERKKLDLDRDVNEYLDFQIPSAFDKPITLRHLLTHSAGFAEGSYKRYSPPQSLREHVLNMPERIDPPGTVTAYSNYGLALAGYIVERVSGEPLHSYVQRNIFDPLGMTRSTFLVTIPEALRPFEAKSYEVASSREPYPPGLIEAMSPVESPAGGLATTARDMTRFMLAHLQQGRIGEHQLLRPETLQEMHAPTFIPIPGAQPVSLGLFRSDYKGHRVLGHSGDGEGWHAEMKLLPEQNVGIYLAVNSDGVVQGGFLPAAFTLRQTLFEAFVDRYFPVPEAKEEPTAATAKEHAQLVAGEYMWSRQQTGDYQEAISLIVRYVALDPTIHANDDGTIVTSPYIAFEKNGRRQTWREVAPFEWREVGGDARLFAQMRDGRVHAVWTDQVPSFWLNLRAPVSRSAGLNMPLLGISLVVLVITAVRGRVYRWSRVAAALSVVYVIGWFLALALDAPSAVGAGMWIRVIQLIGLGCVAGAAVAAWDSWRTWRGDGTLAARAWRTLLALALLFLAWFSFAFHLISVRLT